MLVELPFIGIIICTRNLLNKFHIFPQCPILVLSLTNPNKPSLFMERDTLV
jgi:hypothetical protein